MVQVVQAESRNGEGIHHAWVRRPLRGIHDAVEYKAGHGKAAIVIQTNRPGRIAQPTLTKMRDLGVDKVLPLGVRGRPRRGSAAQVADPPPVSGTCAFSEFQQIASMEHCAVLERHLIRAMGISKTHGGHDQVVHLEGQVIQELTLVGLPHVGRHLAIRRRLDTGAGHIKSHGPKVIVSLPQVDLREEGQAEW